MTLLPGGVRASPLGARFALAAILLLALVGAVFLSAGPRQFVNLDDPEYITENSQVRAGLTAASLRWAGTSFKASNWHPLTWISHMIDVELFGLDPRGHHVTSVVLHAAATVVLLAVLLAATGSLWPGLWVAAAFAVHPLRVESVAWAAERKDVLAALFLMLSLAAYVRYARRPGAGRMAALATVFALGLMAKPMLVTLPLLLVLWDFWPLGRLRRAEALGRLVLEKMPLLGLSALSAVITLKAQAAGTALVPVDVVPVGERAANAAVSALAYLGKMLWPAQLAVYYPRVPGGPSAPGTAAAALLLTALIAVAFLWRRRRPYLLTGCLWYLAALLPVLGLVQVGGQALADRYTYLPSVGVGVGAIWLLRDLVPARRRLRVVVAGAGVVVLLAWSLVAARYTGLWRDGETLFRHALRVTGNNWQMHFCLGGELARQGRIDAAYEEFRESVRILPTAPGWYNIGLAMHVRGHLDTAEHAYRQALLLRPNYVPARENLARILSGRTDRR